MTIYALHVAGDCDSYTCPVCAQEPPADPEPPIPCDHHQRLLDAVHAERPGADLTALATDFATDCDHCEEGS